MSIGKRPAMYAVDGHETDKFILCVFDVGLVSGSWQVATTIAVLTTILSKQVM